jgi:hypothetical protein
VGRFGPHFVWRRRVLTAGRRAWLDSMGIERGGRG